MADETPDNPYCHDPELPAPPIAVPGQILNKPMVERIRACAGDTSSNWTGKITIYPPEARELVALIDAHDGSNASADALRAWPVGSAQWTVIRTAIRWRVARKDRSMSGAEFVRICRAHAEAIDGLPDAIDRPVNGGQYAAGWRDAVATLREDDRYRNWWTSRNYPPAERYWETEPRGHLADYLETVGPDGPEVGGA